MSRDSVVEELQAQLAALKAMNHEKAKKLFFQ